MTTTSPARVRRVISSTVSFALPLLIGSFRRKLLTAVLAAMVLPQVASAQEAAPPVNRRDRQTVPQTTPPIVPTTPRPPRRRPPMPPSNVTPFPNGNTGINGSGQPTTQVPRRRPGTANAAGNPASLKTAAKGAAGKAGGLKAAPRRVGGDAKAARHFGGHGKRGK